MDMDAIGLKNILSRVGGEGRVVVAGLIENKANLVPSWGWGLGLSLAI